MAKELVCIPYKEFVSNPESLFERVVLKNETIVVEKPGGARVMLKPAATRAKRRRRKRTKADYEAFLSSAGGWKGLVDTEKLKEDIYESWRLETS